MQVSGPQVLLPSRSSWRGLDSSVCSGEHRRRPGGFGQRDVSASHADAGNRSTEEPEAGGFAYGATGTGGSEPAYILHSALTVYDERGVLQPGIVQRLPTIENGDWKVCRTAQWKSPGASVPMQSGTMARH